MRLLPLFWWLIGGLCPLLAQSPVPAPAPASATAPLPPPGRVLTDPERAGLHERCLALENDLHRLRQELAAAPTWFALLPDVEVLHKAVDWALRFDEFYAEKEVAFAHHLLDLAGQRSADLRARRAPWLQATGRILRGYRSKLDGSVQPYGLVVPENRAPSAPSALIWLLGRGERRTELAFFAEREAAAPPLLPQGSLVVIPYGRYCNATKFAGEVDVMEVLAATREQYGFDPLRIAVGGFSMGGGSTWHLAVHYPGLWCAATPGAGFAETPVYTRAFAPGKPPRPAWEQTLWTLYDATGYAGNLFQVPTYAYAGAKDPQIQAGEIMAEAMAREGLTLERFVGPDTAHVYHEETKMALVARLEQSIARGRDPRPAEIRFTTYTLRYPECAWLRLEGLERHWQRADVRARLTAPGVVELTSRGVTALTLTGLSLQAAVLDGQSVAFTPRSEPADVRFARIDGRWQEQPEAGLLVKRPGLTGPINDAFMEPFLFVRPTGKPLHAQVGTWVESELSAASTLWRRIARAQVPVKADTDVSDQDLAGRNLVLWGDPSSNALLARLLPQLPLVWTKERIEVRGQSYSAQHHAPILIFPNPLNPRRYVVINSGLDLRGDSYLSNALQTPKLPDWAVIDLREPPGPRWPGKVAAAGFFDETWR